MKQLDEIIYDAIKADEGIMAKIAYTTPQGTTAHAIKSTCFEVPPDALDNTPVPYIIVHDSGFQNQLGTKDCVWESDEDQVAAVVEIAAESPDEVKDIARSIRKAVETHVAQMYQEGQNTPQLQSLTSQGIDWDYEKPCYYQHLNYQCLAKAPTDDEQEET